MSNISLEEQQLYFMMPEAEVEWEKLEARWRAGMLLSAGYYEEALSAYEHALQLDPESCEAWKGKVDALLCLGRLREAESAHRYAQELDPTMKIGEIEFAYGTAP